MKKTLWILVLSFMTPALAAEVPDADSTGGKLFTQKCSACHSLPSPRRLDWPHWRHMLGLMKERMDERGVSEPTKTEWQQIAAYLKSHAR